MQSSAVFQVLMGNLPMLLLYGIGVFGGLAFAIIVQNAARKANQKKRLESNENLSPEFLSATEDIKTKGLARFRWIISIGILLVAIGFFFVKSSTGDIAFTTALFSTLVILPVVFFGSMIRQIYVTRKKTKAIMDVALAGKYDEALHLLQHTNLHSNTRQMIYLSVLVAAGQNTKAEQICRAVLASDGINSLINRSRKSIILLNLSHVLTRQKRYEEAKTVLEECSTILPKIPQPLIQLAQVDLLQGAADSAIEQISKAIELSSKLPANQNASSIKDNILLMHAWALALSGNSDRANEIIEELFQREPTAVVNKARLYYFAGRTMCAQNNNDKALSYFKNAIQLDPNGAIGQLAKEAMESLQQNVVPQVQNG